MTESAKALQAFNDYLALGDGRSLDALLRVYRERIQTAGISVPTLRRTTLETWSRAFTWQARIAGLIVQEREDAERRRSEERRGIFESGLGLDFRRVQALKLQADKQEDLLNRLTDRLLERTKPESEWPDGTGPSRLAHAFRMAYDAFMGTLEAIRKETGADKPIDVTDLIRQKAIAAGVDPDVAVAEAMFVLHETAGSRR